MESCSNEISLQYVDAFQQLVCYEINSLIKNLTTLLAQTNTICEALRNRIMGNVPESEQENNLLSGSMRFQSENFFGVIGNFVNESRKYNAEVVNNLEFLFLFNEPKSVKVVIEDTKEEFVDEKMNDREESIGDTMEENEITDQFVVPTPDWGRYLVGYTFWANITLIFEDGLTFCATNLSEVEELNLTVENMAGKLCKPLEKDIFGVTLSNEEDGVARAVLLKDKVYFIDFGTFCNLKDLHGYYELKEESKKVPAKAVKCFLIGVNEPKLEIPKEKSYFVNILQKNTGNVAKFRVIYKMEDTLFVHISDPEEEDFSEDDGFEMWRKALDLSVGKIYTMIITYVFGTSFYGQISDEVDSPRNHAYTDQEVIPNSLPLYRPLRKDDIYMGKSNNDNLWYRVKVDQVDEENDVVVVRYVDFGDREFLTCSRLVTCPEQLLILPFEAIHCQLAGLIDLTQGDCELIREATSIMEHLIDKEIKIEIEEKTITDDKELLYTVRICNSEFDILSKELVRKGCAIYTELINDDIDFLQVLPSSSFNSNVAGGINQHTNE